MVRWTFLGFSRCGRDDTDCQLSRPSLSAAACSFELVQRVAVIGCGGSGKTTLARQSVGPRVPASVARRSAVWPA